VLMPVNHSAATPLDTLGGIPMTNKPTVVDVTRTRDAADKPVLAEPA
jgi:hypothetical protein